MIIVHGRAPRSKLSRSALKRQQGRARAAKLQRMDLPKAERAPTRYTRPTPQIQSLNTNVGNTLNTNIMDPFQLAKERPEIAEEIRAKARRITLLYNKGVYGYVTDDMDVTTLGSRSRR